MLNKQTRLCRLNLTSSKGLLDPPFGATLADALRVAKNFHLSEGQWFAT
jgi:hypothetical protein